MEFEERVDDNDDVLSIRRTFMGPILSSISKMEESMILYRQQRMFQDGVKARTNLIILLEYCENLIEMCTSLRDDHIEGLNTLENQSAGMQRSIKRKLKQARRDRKRIRRRSSKTGGSPIELAGAVVRDRSFDSSFRSFDRSPPPPLPFDSNGENCANNDRSSVIDSEERTYLPPLPPLDFSCLIDDYDGGGGNEQPEEQQQPREIATSTTSDQIDKDGDDDDLAVTVSDALNICGDDNDFFSQNSLSFIDDLVVWLNDDETDIATFPDIEISDGDIVQQRDDHHVNVVDWIDADAYAAIDPFVLSAASSFPMGQQLHAAETTDDGNEHSKEEQQPREIATTTTSQIDEGGDDDDDDDDDDDLATIVGKALNLCGDNNEFSQNGLIDDLAKLLNDEQVFLPFDDDDIQISDIAQQRSDANRAAIDPSVPPVVAASSSLPLFTPPCWWGRAFDDGTRDGMMSKLQEGSDCVYVPFVKLKNMFICTYGVTLSQSSKLPVIETCYYINGSLSYGKKNRRKPSARLQRLMHETFGFEHDSFAFNAIFNGENEAALLEFDKSYCDLTMLNNVESVFSRCFTLKPWTVVPVTDDDGGDDDDDDDSSRVILHGNNTYISLRSFVNVTIGIRRLLKIDVDVFQFFLVVKKGNQWLKHDSANIVISTGEHLVLDHALKDKMDTMKVGESYDIARVKNNRTLSVPKHGCNVAFSDVNWCGYRDGGQEVALTNLELLSTCARPSCFDFNRIVF